MVSASLVQTSFQMLSVMLVIGACGAPCSAAVIPYDQVVSSMNPIAYWRHENNPADSTVNAHNGTLAGTATYVSGPVLPGITGNTAGSYGGGGITDITVPDANALSFGNGVTDAPFTISTWINPSTPSGAFNGIIGKDNGTQREWALLMQTDRTLRFFVKDNGGSPQLSVDTTFAAPISEWSHIVATYDGSSTVGGLNIWVNGSSATLTNPIVGSYTAMANTTANLTLGSYSTNFFEGRIDETALFGEVLSGAQISALSGEAQFPIPEPSSFLLLSMGVLIVLRSRRARRTASHEAS